jgi:hypothetical protein
MKTSILAATAALMALTSAQAAQAKQACVAPADLSASAVYVLPIAYVAARSVCAKTLKPTGYMATKGDKVIAPFRAKQTKSWPGTFRMIKIYLEQNPGIAGNTGFDVVGMLSSLPEANIRPFADGMIGQYIAGKIKPAHCTRIERGMELLGPLPSDNVAELFAFIADVAELKNPTLCDPRTR